MIPSIGRTVVYTLTSLDADAINKRRRDATLNMDKIREDSLGYMAHVGNEVRPGDEFPMVIVRIWGDPTSEYVTVNGQVFLDGTDTFWALSRCQGDEPGRWHEPVHVEVKDTLA